MFFPCSAAFNLVNFPLFDIICLEIAGNYYICTREGSLLPPKNNATVDPLPVRPNFLIKRRDFFDSSPFLLPVASFLISFCHFLVYKLEAFKSKEPTKERERRKVVLMDKPNGSKKKRDLRRRFMAKVLQCFKRAKK